MIERNPRPGARSRRRIAARRRRIASLLTVLAACGTPPSAPSGGGAPHPAPGDTTFGLLLAPDTLVLPAAPTIFTPAIGSFTAWSLDGDEPTVIGGAGIAWASSDPTIARLSDRGLVAGGRAGVAYVTATVGTRAGTAVVRVVDAPDTTISVIAHRGFQLALPENTLVAITGAFDLGADAVEIDVRRTRDGVPVLMHDATVDRTTDGTGAVADLTAQQIAALDACTRASPRRPPCAVPTLREALGAARARGLLVIHFYGAFDAPALAAVLADVRAADMHDRVVLTAFEYSVVQQLRALDPFVAVGWITTRVPPLDGVRALGRSAVLVDMRALLDEPVDARALLQQARALGVDVAAWTARSQEDAERLVELGVRHLVTDVPLDRAALAAARR